MEVDFSKTSYDYARYRAGFPASFFERLEKMGILRPGLQVVDVATGTGTLARGIVNLGCQVTALDAAPNQVRAASEIDIQAEVPIRHLIAKAEHTGLPDNFADLVTAGQSWHWFDRAAAAQEVKRLLKPGGRLVIAHFDWIPLRGNLVAATEALVLRFNPRWKMAGGTGLYPAWLQDLGEAGFDHLESFSYDVDIPYTHEDWRGRLRASAGVGASLPPEKVSEFDQALADLLANDFPSAVLKVPHRIFAIIGKKPGPSQAHQS